MRFNTTLADLESSTINALFLTRFSSAFAQPDFDYVTELIPVHGSRLAEPIRRRGDPPRRQIPPVAGSSEFNFIWSQNII
jgi:hypothetical protein